ncbi:hypothetical protein COCMIDRAFT_90425 [Bipolaris oryzae ATCC 44560]|uniref:Uncharacterized protein n=1 Tax=Bipolaris oryzae ATCC 44560 TaxID=930090 RepID=W6ZBX5_COCMI|nr:uncharacterized protein COCMIDRAFT_90425 [Bipolaris oryzae ATCC 44560]EUC47303.1 hypothetical protein COCMIDRAFT_90425 [Bipolaris oryzae ATCC 44560]
MSFNLDVLFFEPADLCLDNTAADLHKHETSQVKDGELLWMADVNDEELEEGECEQRRLRSTIAHLNQQCDHWKAQAEEYGKIIAELDQRTSRDTAHPKLPRDILRRINRLEGETVRQRAENAQLKKMHKTTERENVLLGTQNENKANKLKGANIKVKNAKQVASKEEGKAKEAMEAKQRHLPSQRKMKKERDNALAAMQEQKKSNEGLRAELDTEQSGAPHMRDTAVDPDNTVVVVPIEFEARWVDVQRIMVELNRHQIAWTADIEAWYKEWRGLGRKKRGAENDGQRSRCALEASCRYTEACHDEEVYVPVGSWRSAE